MFGQTLKLLVVFTVLAIGHLTLTAVGAPTQIFKDKTSPRLQTESWRGVRADVGDVDNDGDLDVIVANGCHSALDCSGTYIPNVYGIEEQRFLLQINDGAGNFTDEAVTRLPNSGAAGRVASAAILGDVNGDNRLDVFVANGSSDGDSCPGSQNRLWINGVSGSFTDVTATNLPPIGASAPLDSSFHAAFGDVDKDGDLDIVVANVGCNGLGERNRILINDGSGHFADETTSRLPTLSEKTYAVALHDVDADGDLDIVEANAHLSGTTRSRVLLNNGGSFTSMVNFYVGGGAMDVAVADIDGQGSLDIVFAGPNGVHFVKNYNGGTYSQSWIPLPNAHGLALADVDNDNDTDIFVTGSPHTLRLNDGTGVFTDHTATDLPAVGGIVRYASFLDVENDGDADLYIPMWVNWDPEPVDPVHHQDRLLINTISSTGVDPDIDIKPGSDPNCFNINGRGVIPVAILGSDTFDVFQINQSSLLFAGLDVRVRGSKGPLCSFEDSNADGFADLVCQFEDDPNAWSPGVSEATLEGKLMDETAFQGTDSICVVQ